MGRRRIYPTLDALINDKETTRAFILKNIEINMKSGCWHWNHYQNEDKFGFMRFRRDDGYGKISAARVAWMIYRSHEPVPEGWRLKRDCQVNSCIRPDHMTPTAPPSD